MMIMIGLTQSYINDHCRVLPQRDFYNLRSFFFLSRSAKKNVLGFPLFNFVQKPYRIFKINREIYTDSTNMTLKEKMFSFINFRHRFVKIP